MARVSRSQFIEKLHALLEQPLDETSLRWISKDAFEISSNEAKARVALSPSYDFRSLSSFIRQLSYYSFKRLSDRRRSGERRSTAASYIIFTHPSGQFMRGDASKLHLIVRKTRVRASTKGDSARRASISSVHSSGASDAEPAATPLQPWQQVSENRHPYSQGRPPQHQQQAPLPSPHHQFPAMRLSTNDGGGPQWRAYNPPVAWSGPDEEERSQGGPHHRASTSSSSDSRSWSPRENAYDQYPARKALPAAGPHPHSDIHNRSPYPPSSFPSTQYTTVEDPRPSGMTAAYGSPYESFEDRSLPSPSTTTFTARSESPPNPLMAPFNPAPVPLFTRAPLPTHQQQHFQSPLQHQHQHQNHQYQQHPYSSINSGMAQNWGRRDYE